MESWETSRKETPEILYLKFPRSTQKGTSGEITGKVLQETAKTNRNALW